MLLKKHSSSVEFLPHDVVDLILERLPVETLLLFKSVSKKWNSTIGSRRFQERQLIRRMQSRGLDVLFVSLGNGKALEKRKTVLGSSIISTARFPTSSDRICHSSCDGLVCLSSIYYPSLVINLSFDLHTETFQIISKTPFAHISDPRHVNMCILENRLCVSKKNSPTQDIWSYDSSDGNMTWEKIYSIDLTKTYTWFGILYRALTPIAILDKNKLLLHNRGNLKFLDPLVIHDLHTKSYNLLFEPTTTGYCVCYFQSLFSL